MKKFILTAILLLALGNSHAQITKSGLDVQGFDLQIAGKQNHLYTITNKNGMELCVMNFGARVVSLTAPDRNGKFEDVVLGYKNAIDYLKRPQNFGANVGRFVGRILNATYTLDGQKVTLSANNKFGDCAHGGDNNFAQKMWNTEKVGKQSITFSYLSPDGENGFPGNLKVFVTYKLTDDNELDIEYKATTDKPTVVNLTHHSFFNISGNMQRSVEGQTLWVKGDSIIEYDKDKRVTGNKIEVKNTAFDFTHPHLIGEKINQNHPQLAITNGYDHCWTITKWGEIKNKIAYIYDITSGRMMSVFTTEPGLQIYSGNGLNGSDTGKNNIRYQSRSGICFETCHFQNSPNIPSFPSTVVRPGKPYKSHTIYKFDVLK
jgi:aldose 1-epimerase